MVRIFVDCEMNAECIGWLEDLIDEEDGSKAVARSFIMVIQNALEAKLKEKIGYHSSDGQSLLEITKKLRSSIVQDLDLLRVNNHGTDFPKAFLKVVWHQLLEKHMVPGPKDTIIRLPSVTQFEEETILSSYVKDVDLEIIENSPVGALLELKDGNGLKDMIDGILSNRESEQTKFLKDLKLSEQCRMKSLSYEMNFYINIEDKQGNLDSCISQEFDNIGLSDSGNNSDSTLFETVHTRLPLTLKHLKEVKVTLLPSVKFDKQWEMLHYDSNLKEKMYSHGISSLKLSHLLEKCKTKIRKNNLFLLHGPPGTGKTTLCKSFCQKLALRNCNLFDSGHSGILVEVSCSQIFSRWFGESTKNLDGIFNDIERLLKHEQASKKFVCLLFDEVESLAISRHQLLNTNETTDSVRVLNCLMTHLDNLKKYPNFILLCTSNLRENIDPAFLDRLDVSFYVGFPSVTVCQQILTNITQEMINSEIIFPDENEFEMETIIKKLAVFSNVCVVPSNNMFPLEQKSTERMY